VTPRTAQERKVGETLTGDQLDRGVNSGIASRGRDTSPLVSPQVRT